MLPRPPSSHRPPDAARGWFRGPGRRFRMLAMIAMVVGCIGDPGLCQQPAGDPGRRGAGLEAAGLQALTKGDHTRAAARMAQAVEAFRRAGDAHGQGRCLYWLATAEHGGGDLAAASGHLREALELLTEPGQRWLRAYAANRLLAIVSAGSPTDAEAAYAVARQAEAVLDASNPVEALLDRFASTHSSRSPDDAWLFFSTALAAESAVGHDAARLARLEMACAQIARDRKDTGAVARHCENALALRGSVPPSERVKWLLFAADQSTEEPGPVPTRLREALDEARSAGDTALLAQVHLRIAPALRKAGHMDEAVAEFETAATELRDAPWGTPHREDLLGQALIELGEACEAASAGSAAVAAYEEAAAVYEAAGQPREAAGAHHRLGRALAAAGDLAGAECHIEAHLDYYRSLGDPAALLTPLREAGAAYLRAAKADPSAAGARAESCFAEFLRTQARVDGSALARQSLVVATLYANAKLPFQALGYCERARAEGRARGDQLVQAEALATAASAHAARGAYADALACADEAIALVRAAGQEARAAPWLLQSATWARQATGDASQSLDRYERALALYEELGRTAQEAAVCQTLAGLYDSALDDPGIAAQYYRRAAELLTQGGDQGAQRRARQLLPRLAGVLRRSGDDAEAARVLERCARDQESAGDSPEERARTQEALADILLAGSDFDEARSCLRRALDLYREVSPPSSIAVATVLLKLAESYHLSGDLASAVEQYEEALASLVGVEAVSGLRAYAYGGLSHALVLLGRHDAAVRARSEAVANERSLAHRLETVLSVVFRPRTASDRPRALAFFERVLEVEDAIGDQGGLRRASACRNIASLYQADGRVAEAEPLLARAAELFATHGWPQEEVVILESLGLIRERLGDWLGATEAYRRAIELYGEMGDPRGRRSELAFVVTRILDDHGRPDDAAPYRALAGQDS